jgi:hypothetical protein
LEASFSASLLVAAITLIYVNNFYDVEEPASQFIPLYSNNKVVGVSIFREYDVGEKKLGRMSEISNNREYFIIKLGSELFSLVTSSRYNLNIFSTNLSSYFLRFRGI